jgi:hypothetical protein
MANKLLLTSTIIMVIIHYISLYKYNSKNTDLLIYSILFGLITSLLNHGLSHNVFKILDRTMMVIAFFINIYFSGKIYSKIKDKYHIENAYLLTIFAVLLFFCTKFLLKSGKLTVNYIPHLFAHIIISIANGLILREYYLLNKN